MRIKKENFLSRQHKAKMQICLVLLFLRMSTAIGQYPEHVEIPLDDSVGSEINYLPNSPPYWDEAIITNRDLEVNWFWLLLNLQYINFNANVLLIRVLYHHFLNFQAPSDGKSNEQDFESFLKQWNAINSVRGGRFFGKRKWSRSYVITRNVAKNECTYIKLV